MSKRIGDLVKVPNTKRKFGSAAHYYHVRVQYEDGCEGKLLLTDHEVSRTSIRAIKNPEDCITPSFIRDALD